ncbi:hypothetical protein [Allohahella marinimesophila]|uniref:arsenate reductase/protein-tyrosine-phosphatase family protein n=1 Tax=Allohahella marinimesophila TaxID=1054972 RepID=UPI0031E17D5B
MGSLCAVFRLDEFEDAGAAYENVESMANAGFHFVNPVTFFRARDSSEFDAEYAALLVVHAYSYDYFLHWCNRLKSLDVPFLLVGNSATFSRDSRNWSVVVREIFAKAPDGDYEVSFGPGLVKYRLEKSTRDGAVRDVIRRLALVGPRERDSLIHAFEKRLNSEDNLGPLKASQSATAVLEIATDLLPACVAIPEPAVSRLVSEDLFQRGLATARKRLGALGGECRTGMHALPFHHDYWESRCGAAQEEVCFAYSYTQSLCSGKNIKEGAIPQLKLPIADSDISRLKTRIRRSQQFIPLSRLSYAHYYGGKNALLKSVSASLMSWIGSYRDYRKVNFEQIQRVVFFCKGNINRSAYAACSFRSKIKLEAVSFGLCANDHDAASTPALERALREGLDLTEHVTTSMASFLPRDGDLYVAFEPEHIRICQSDGKFNSKVAQFTLAGIWSIPCSPYIQDPIVRSEVYYERCFDLISSSVEQLVNCLNTSSRSET